MLTAAPCARTTRPWARIAPAPTCTSPSTTAERAISGWGSSTKSWLKLTAASSFSPPLVFQGPVGAIRLVQPVEFGHVRLGQGEVEDLRVLLDSFAVGLCRASATGSSRPG